MAVAEMPEVPGGVPAILSLAGIIATGVITHFTTRYTTRSGAQISLNDAARDEVKLIFARHVEDLDRKNKEIVELRDEVRRLDVSNDECQRKTMRLEGQVADLRRRLDSLERPWDGRSERRGRDD